MKICFINNLYPPYSRGGAERAVEGEIKALSGEEKVLLVTITDRLDLRPKTEKKDNLIIYRFFPWNLFSFVSINKKNVLIRFFWHIFDVLNVHSYFVVKKILKKEKPEVVYTHNLKGLGYLIPRAIKSLKIKHVHTLHDVQLVSPSGLIIKGKENSFAQRIFLRKWYELVCRALFKSPSEVRSPSKWLLDFYSERGFFPESKKVVWREPLPRQESLLNKENLGSQFNFLYVGQIEESKGIIFLIKAFKKFKISRADLDLKLDIIGEGSKLSEVEQLIRDDLDFKIHGFLSPQEVNTFFIQADATIVPSLCYENSPRVIAESLKGGVPVIASRIGGIPEAVAEGQNGWLFEAGNEDKLFETLGKIIDKK